MTTPAWGAQAASTIASPDDRGAAQGRVRRNRGTLVNAGAFSAASLISGLVAFGTSFASALFLGPAIFGVWQGARLFLAYGGLAHLGTVFGMHREIPLLKGRADAVRQEVLAASAFSFNLLSTGLAATAIAASTFIVPMPGDWSLALRFVAVLVFSQGIVGFYGSLFRAHNEFRLVSRVVLVGSVGSLVGLTLIIAFGFIGFLAGQVLASVVAAAYSVASCRHRVRWSLDRHALRYLVLIGVPIVLATLGAELFNTVDRYLILRVYDEHALGLYALGSLAFTPVITLAAASSSVLYPVLAEGWGRDASRPRFLERLNRVLGLAGLGLAAAAGATYALLPVAVPLVLPNYVDGIPAAQALGWGLAGTALMSFVGYAYLALGRMSMLLVLWFTAAAVDAALTLGALQLDAGLVGVAWARSAATLLLTLASVLLLSRLLAARPRDGLLLTARVVGPLGVVMLALMGLSALAPPALASPGLLLAAQSLLLALLLSGPFRRGLQLVRRWTEESP